MASVVTTLPGLRVPLRARPQSGNTALSDTNQILTPEQIVGFLFSMTPTASRTVTLPSATTMVNYLTKSMVSDAIEFVVRNFGTTGNVITVVSGSASSGNLTVPGGSAKRFIVRITNANPSAATYTLEVLTADVPVSGLTDNYPFAIIDFNTDPNPFGPIPFLDATVFLVIVPSVSDTYVVQLPLVASLVDNKKIFVIKDSGNASASRAVRVQATGTNTINPASGSNATGDFFDLVVAGSALTVLANPSSVTAWEVI